MQKPDRVFTRQELLAVVCGRQADERMPEAIDVNVCRLRQCLGEAGNLIETVRFIGYRLCGRVDQGQWPGDGVTGDCSSDEGPIGAAQAG